MPQLSSYPPLSSSALLPIGESLLPFVTVGPTGTFSDYITDGTADEVQINAAITAVNSAGSGTVLLRPGTYYVNAAIAPKSYVAFKGAGKQKTFIRFGTAATASNLVTSGAGPYYNWETADITFDAEDKANAGIMNFSSTVQGFNIHDCEFLNMTCDNSHSHWPLRLGIINDADVAGSASYNLSIYNNLFSNLACGTFEVILVPNIRESFIHHNKFINNTTSATSEMSFYSQNYNCRYSENIHINWSDRAVHIGEGQNVDIVNNTFSNSTAASPTAIDIRNLANCKINNNEIIMPASNTGGCIVHFDANVGRDGHAQVNPNSYNVDISNNTLTNAYYGIVNTSVSSGANYSYKNFTIDHNKFYNCLKSPIRFGPNTTGVTMDIEYIYVRYNVIDSWSGNIEGGISFYGDSTAPTNIKNLYIEDNSIADNTSGASSGAVRISAAQAQTVKNNNMVVSTGSFGSLSTPNSGSVVYAKGNTGYNPVGLVTVAVPLSGSSTTAAAYDQTFYITAGTSTCACAVTNATGTSQTVATIPVSGFGAVFVPANATLKPTYTNAPTWTVQGN